MAWELLHERCRVKVDRLITGEHFLASFGGCVVYDYRRPGEHEHMSAKAQQSMKHHSTFTCQNSLSKLRGDFYPGDMTETHMKDQSIRSGTS